MKKISYTILSLLLLTNNISVQGSENVKADNDAITEEDQSDSISDIPNDYITQLQQALQEQERLKALKSGLETTKSNLKEQERELSNNLKNLKNDVANAQKEVRNLSEKLNKPTISDLRAKREQLNNMISKNKRHLDFLSNELTALNTQLHEYETKKGELDGIKDNISERLITENQPYIKQPFSKLSSEKLKQIHDKCSPYTMDQPLKEFVDQVEKTIKNKETYDEICKILNSPYQKDAINRSFALVDAMQTVSDGQKTEIAEIRHQLNSFADGLNIFKEFINRLNDCRKGINKYSLEFFQTDKERIYDGLAEEIEKTLLIVPYLKTKYKEFFTKFNKNPNIHSDIEKEILNQ